MKAPLITCAILCHNYGRYLAAAIESCLGQEPGEYRHEILVLDDGSTDNTPEVCAAYEGRIRVSRSVNLGFGATLSRAVNEAKGDVVALLDADDLFAPSKLRHLAEECARGVVFVSHGMRQIDEHGGDLGGGEGGNTSTIAFLRSPALDLLPVCNELDFHILRFGCRSSYLVEALATYRIHPKSMTDRSAPSAHAAYFAGVKLRFAEKARQLLDRPPGWLSDRRRLKHAAEDFRVEGLTDDFEAAVHEWKSTRLAESFRLMLAARFASCRWNQRVIRLAGRCIIKFKNEGVPV